MFLLSQQFFTISSFSILQAININSNTQEKSTQRSGEFVSHDAHPTLLGPPAFTWSDQVHPCIVNDIHYALNSLTNLELTYNKFCFHHFSQVFSLFTCEHISISHLK